MRGRSSLRPTGCWLLAGLALVACGGRKSDGGDAATAPVSQVALLDEARALLVDQRTESRTLEAEADRVETSADAEAGTARGALLSAMSGALRLRAFRATGASDVEGGKRALAALTKASARADFAESCAPASLRARLLGELAHDPSIAYRELYLARRRMPASCALELDEAIDRVSPFRPSASVLAELDRTLVNEGVVVPEADAGAKVSTPARIVRVSRWTTADSARVVLELDKAADWLLETAPDGGVRVRLEGVDLARSDPGAAASLTSEESKGLLRGGGLATYVPTPGEPAGTTLTLTLARPSYRRVFFLPDPYRIVVDLDTKPLQTEATGSGPRPLRRVVLDAGHGGNDPGAIGPSGLREKDVTLAIATLAAPTIARELGAEVRLTRGKDVFVSLEERAAIGNALGADVFLSIHCNAAETHAKRGIEIYVLDTARDELAGRVAARENGGGLAAPGQLRAILDDLKIAELGARSQHLAELLSKSTMSSLHAGSGGAGQDYGDVSDGGVHGAGFFVLVGARMPAVLLEASFISNPIEEGYLARPDYRQRFADAIVNALRAYKDGK